MIASVVATLTDDAEQLQATLAALSSRSEFELGEFAGHARRIPLTIDAQQRSNIEELTKWIESRAGVAFVDVVFVHFEEQHVKNSDQEARLSIRSHSA